MPRFFLLHLLFLPLFLLAHDPWLEGESLEGAPQAVISRAVRDLQTAASAQDSAQSYYLQGVALLYVGENEAALTRQRQALALFQRGTRLEGQSDVYNQIGFLQYKWGALDSALQAFHLADSLARLAGYARGQAEAQKNLAKYHHTLGEFAQSIRLNQTAQELARAAGDTALLLTIAKNLGDDYESRGDYARALGIYLDALALAQRTEDRLATSSLFSHLGNLYALTGHRGKALSAHTQALELRQEINYREGVAKTLQNLGLLYVDLGQPQQARRYFDRSLRICREIGYHKGLIKCHNSLGGLAFDEGKQKEAKAHFVEALRLSTETSYDKGLIIAHQQLGELAREAGQLTLAESHFRQALTLAGHDQVPYLALESCWALYQLTKAKGQTAAALAFLEQYEGLRETLLGEEKSRALAEVQVQHETEKKEQENEMLRQKNELQALKLRQNRWFVGLFGVIAALLLGFLLLLYGRFRQKIHTNRKLETLNHRLNEANAEKDKFFAIIAHELRNPLFWVRNLTGLLTRNFQQLPPDRLSKAIHAIDDSAQNAYHLIDNLLQWARTQLHRLGYQPQAVRLAPLLQQNIDLFASVIRQKQVEVTLAVPDAARVWADPDQLQVVFRNLLSNALKYTPEGGQVQLSAQARGDQWEVAVSDTGIGMSAAQQAKLFQEHKPYTTLGISQEKGSGIGLMLCRDFVARNGGQLSLKSEPGQGTTFQVWLPCPEPLGAPSPQASSSVAVRA